LSISRFFLNVAIHSIKLASSIVTLGIADSIGEDSETFVWVRTILPRITSDAVFLFPISHVSWNNVELSADCRRFGREGSPDIVISELTIWSVESRRAFTSEGVDSIDTDSPVKAGSRSAVIIVELAILAREPERTVTLVCSGGLRGVSAPRPLEAGTGSTGLNSSFTPLPSEPLRTSTRVGGNPVQASAPVQADRLSVQGSRTLVHVYLTSGPSESMGAVAGVGTETVHAGPSILAEDFAPSRVDVILI